jgi:hypothetical protein
VSGQGGLRFWSWKKSWKKLRDVDPFCAFAGDCLARIGLIDCLCGMRNVYVDSLVLGCSTIDYIVGFLRL